MRLLPGTSVIRLYPGSVQVGTDPGHEVVFSGLLESQEEWLLSCTQPVCVPACSRVQAKMRIPVPDNCQKLAERLIREGFGYQCDESGLRVLVCRVEEPTLMGLEAAIGHGSIELCAFSDERPTSGIAFTHEHISAHHDRMDRWASEHMDVLFPDLPLPLFSDFDLELRSVPLNQTFCEDPEIFTASCPRLIIRVGQVSSMIGPLLTESSPVCPLCIALWTNDDRRGVAPQDWYQASYSPRINHRMKLEAAAIISDFLDAYCGARRQMRTQSFHDLWSTRVIRIDHWGNSRVEQVGTHPDYHCLRKGMLSASAALFE